MSVRPIFQVGRCWLFDGMIDLNSVTVWANATAMFSSNEIVLEIDIGSALARFYLVFLRVMILLL
jgi:hypothetical protein